MGVAEGHVSRTLLERAVEGAELECEYASGAPATVAKSIVAISTASVALYGALGDDDVGARYGRDLPDTIELVARRIAGIPTGLFVALGSDEGYRRYADPGCSGRIDPSAIRGADITYVDGYLLTEGDRIERVFDAAERHGSLIAYAPAHAGLVAGRKELVRKLIERADYAFMNDDELAALGYGKGSAEDAMELAKRSRTDLIVSRGPLGAIAFHARSGNAYTVHPETIHPHSRVGAGDALAGAFLGALARDEAIEGALAQAARYASEWCAHHESSDSEGGSGSLKTVKK
jgi:sugar/nucleoside kinase (ribokinase family)